MALSIVAPASARADDPPLTQDYNAFWQAVESNGAPNPNQDYNSYWQQVQTQQEIQQLQQ
jgi:hypothetical protein